VRAQRASCSASHKRKTGERNGRNEVEQVMRRARPRLSLASETGSIAPLAIGLASIMLATTFTFVNVGSLLLFQQRETQLAEALSLAVDDALTAGQLGEALNDNSVLTVPARSFAADAGIRDFEVSTTDGKTVTAKVCGVYDAPIKVPLIPRIADQTVCAIAKARRT
jgi:hypothetical protein